MVSGFPSVVSSKRDISSQYLSNPGRDRMIGELPLGSLGICNCVSSTFGNVDEGTSRSLQTKDQRHSRWEIGKCQDSPAPRVAKDFPAKRPCWHMYRWKTGLIPRYQNDTGLERRIELPRAPSSQRLYLGSESSTYMDFPEQLKATTEKAYSSWREAQSLTEEERKSRFRRAVRVTAKYGSELRRELRSGELSWYSDAGKAVGGIGEHPGALQHFISGLPLCQMTHYAERASVGGLRIEELEVSAVGRYVGLSGYPFDEIEFEVRVSSPESPERIKELAMAATNDCYVTNTLKRACSVHGRIFLNGEHLVDI